MTHDHAPGASAAPGAWRARTAALLAAAGALGATVLAVVGLVDPNEPGHFPGCPFLALTGYWCPGCGSTRMLHALVHGDLATALARNPLGVVALAWLTGWYGVQWWRVVADRPRRGMAHPRWVYALGVVIVGYWVARNVPGWTWLSPA